MLSGEVGGAVYEWDGANRLSSITKGVSKTEVTYDGFNRWNKIVEKTNGVVTSTKNFIWCGLEICEERNFAGQGKKFFDQGFIDYDGTKYWYTKDHLGSVREVVKSDKSLAVRYNYEPYGKRTRINGNLETDFGYTGHYLHQASGLYFAPFRAYSSALGRWINRDPIGEKGGLNQYGYVKGKVSSSVDSDGLLPIDTIWDLGNVVYDIYNGDNENLAYDSVALLTPYVPAGLNRACKAVSSSTKYLRRKAVRQAWRRERENIAGGQEGTRKWTDIQLEELKETGKISGYEGHHINSVNGKS